MKYTPSQQPVFPCSSTQEYLLDPNCAGRPFTLNDACFCGHFVWQHRRTSHAPLPVCPSCLGAGVVRCVACAGEKGSLVCIKCKHEKSAHTIESAKIPSTSSPLRTFRCHIGCGICVESAATEAALFKPQICESCRGIGHLRCVCLDSSI